MPEGLKKMAALAFGHIAYNPYPALHVEHDPAMQNCVRQPEVSIMATGKEIEGLAVQPCFGSHVWEESPCERAFGNSLIEVVDSEGVVRRCAAEPVAFFSVDITVGAGINQKASSVKREAKAERIGMAVARISVALRTGIDHQLL